MHELWYDYVKPKYGDNTKLCYLDTDSFIIYVKQKTFTETMLEMFKQDLNLKNMNQTDCWRKNTEELTRLSKER